MKDIRYPVVILAGGLASRLKPITEEIPKAAIIVAGKPFIIWQLDYLQSQRIKKVIICVGHLEDQIKQIVKDYKKNKMEIYFSSDGPELLGTGGAIKKALAFLNDNFFVLYGDSFLPVDYYEIQSFFNEESRVSLMTVYRNEGHWDTSNVEYIGNKIIEYNKQNPRDTMKFIDYGLGILSPKVFDRYSLGEKLDLSEVYHQLSIQGDLAGFEVNQRFYEIGSHKGLEDTIQYFTSK